MQAINPEAIQREIQAGRGQQLSESRQTSHENERRALLLPRDEIQEVWRLMTHLYGHKWTSSHGDQVDPGNVWAACLRGVSTEQVRRGLNQCVVRGLEWPPSAPEFRKLCTGEDAASWEHARVKAADREAEIERAARARLEDKTAQERARKAGAAQLSAMRNLFGQSGTA